MIPDVQSHFETPKKIGPNPQKSYDFLITLVTIMFLSGGYAVWFISNYLYAYDEVDYTAYAPRTHRVSAAQIATSTVDTTDWQTYRNEEYGFEFMYPKDWILEKNNSSISLDSPENYANPLRKIEILIALDKNPNKLAAKEYYNGKNGILAFDNSNQDSEIIIDGTKSYQLYPATGESPGTLVIIPLKDIFIRFDVSSFKENSNSVLSKILSTFKFLP